MRTLENRKTAWTPWAAALLGGFLLAGAALAQPAGGYAYLRVIDGPAAQLDSGSDHFEATPNQPLLRGDHLTVPERGRVETVLADGSLVRVDGGSEISFERLAGSADGDDRASVLSLTAGNLQLVVRQDSRALDFPRIDTGNSTIYIEAYGVYRITADGSDWSQLVVRQGRAKVVTDGDETEVGPGQSATAEGSEKDAELGTEPAAALDPIETWGRRLDDDARLAENSEDAVEPDYRYEASSLASYGSWIDVDGSRYWRPRVDDDWRPYWRGHWTSTPSGLTWVSSDPWGWLPAHYGTWDFLPTYGWAWQPGYVYSPAWVYWYWGPTHIGWCPTGYYTHFYGASLGADVGFRLGVYGWAGGDWGSYGRWNFAPIDRFGSRDLFRYTRPGRDFGGDGRHAVPRGLITTDTRGIGRGDWNKPQRVAEILGRGVRAGGPRSNGRPGAGGMVRQAGDLPDVTSFVARKPLAPEQRTRIVADRSDRRLDGTPLKPATLGEVPGRGGRTGRPAVASGEGVRPSRGRSGEGVRPTDPLTPGQTGRPRRDGSGDPAAQAGAQGSAGWRNHTAPAPGNEGSPDTTGRPGRSRPTSRRPAPGEDGGAPRTGSAGGDSTGSTRDAGGWRNHSAPAPSGGRDDSATAAPDRPSGRRGDRSGDRTGEDKPGRTYDRPSPSAAPDRGSSRREPPPSARPSSPPPSRGDEGKGRSSGHSSGSSDSKEKPKHERKPPPR